MDQPKTEGKERLGSARLQKREEGWKGTEEGVLLMWDEVGKV